MRFLFGCRGKVMLWFQDKVMKQREETYEKLEERVKDLESKYERILKSDVVKTVDKVNLKLRDLADNVSDS